MKTFVLNLRNNLSKIGFVRFGFHGNTGYITNLKINNSFRGKGYGSELLKISENTLKNQYNVEQIKLCTWNSIYDNTSNVNFFKKNGYEMDNNSNYYDNDNDIYEITGFKKITYYCRVKYLLLFLFSSITVYL